MNPRPSCINLVIFDLDGTLIQTETLILAVSQQVVSQYGTEITEEAIAAAIGRRPLDAWQQVIDILSLSDCTAQDLYDQSEALLTSKWHECGILPGASRLVRHLKEHNIALALATSSPCRRVEAKLSNKQDLRNAFDLICCGDDPAVEKGKPFPDCFLHVASKFNVPPHECLVIEDAPSGVQAALAAGMHVVCVPSLRNCKGYPPSIHSISSLLSFEPHLYNLPPFQDLICETVPLDEPWLIGGDVVKGFGRGSKELGIPTANVDIHQVEKVVAEGVTGIYAGWASVKVRSKISNKNDNVSYPMCMSIGWNPLFKNNEKTCEPWVLHDFGDGTMFESIRLVVVGYIRPEADFVSLEKLVERIHRDAEVTKEALLDERYAQHRNHPFLFAP